MIRKCANCREGKRHGWTMVYCTFYGIDISADYDRCARHKPRIVEVENETNRERVRTNVRKDA